MKATEYRIALEHLGVVNPDSIDDYIAKGGYEALVTALERDPSAVVDEIARSGLRGRGGSGFSAAQKSRSTGETTRWNIERYIVCAGDESEPGTYKDRIIMENDPHLLIEGMVLGGYAIGASRGYVFIRGEYTLAIDRITKAIADAGRKGFLGKNIAGSDFSMEIEVRPGAGSYLAGDGFSILEAIEGKRGTPRVRPPHPVEKGLWDKPTLINNVETLAHLPAIVLKGGEWYASMGTATSKGTKIFTVSGDVEQPGYYEVVMGTTLRSLINDFAGGMKGGGKFKAALIGGAAGTFIPEEYLDIPLCYDALREKGFILGAGAVIVYNDTRNIAQALAPILGFFRYNSCGKCVPCRVGTTRLTKLLKHAPEATPGREASLELMLTEATFMAKTSLCAVGQAPLLPIKSALTYFRNDF